jgi:hypothetical protein
MQRLQEARQRQQLQLQQKQQYQQHAAALPARKGDPQQLRLLQQQLRKCS